MGGAIAMSFGNKIFASWYLKRFYLQNKPDLSELEAHKNTEERHRWEFKDCDYMHDQSGSIRPI